jgi:pyruvate carboxylase subunit B
MIEGTRHVYSFEAVPGGFSLIVDGRSYRVEGEAGTDGRVRLRIDGAEREVVVMDERARLLAAYGGAASDSRGEDAVRAPMPGLVVRVLVVAGTRVRRGEGLVILEAMKMENELRAPRDASVQRIHIQAGDTVQKSQLLIELE